MHGIDDKFDLKDENPYNILYINFEFLDEILINLRLDFNVNSMHINC